MRKLIVVGVNTDVGKTVVSAILCEALNATYWKPVQCGHSRDTDWVNQMRTHSKFIPEAYRLKFPGSAHLAARMEGISINEIACPLISDSLVIEGMGGILSPLSDEKNWIDMAINWPAEWVLVHRHYLGSLNHFQLTIEALKARSISLKGIVFNGEGDFQTEEMLLKKANVPCIGRLPWKKVIDRAFIHEKAKEWIL